MFFEFVNDILSWIIINFQPLTVLINSKQFLEQGFQTRGRRAACGPPDVLMRPMSSSIFLYLYLNMHFLPPSSACIDIFSYYAARKFIFIQNAAL